MRRIIFGLASCALCAVMLAGCASSAPSAGSSSADSATSASSASSATSSANATSSADASSSAGASAPAAIASSERVMSSEFASSEMASSEMVLSGPSGISEMNVSMQYISSKDLLAALEAGDKDMLLIDLRKPADVKAGHIEGVITAPMNKAVDNNDYADALANLTSALYDATGNEVGEGRQLVLVCYAGKKYAQAATDILNALGADMTSVYTLEGGMTEWTEGNNPVVTD